MAKTYHGKSQISVFQEELWNPFDQHGHQVLSALTNLKYLTQVTNTGARFLRK